MDTVTVITATRNRPELLRRAISSVHSQDFQGKIVHLIIVDDCQKTVQAFREFEPIPDRELIWFFEYRSPKVRTGPERLAFLRNQAVQRTETRWVALLDDDNEYETNHISSLINCALQTKSPAVHSYRKIYYANGSPYIENRMPWVRGREEGKRVYDYLCDKGVWIRNTNILQDRADPKGHPDPIRLVDSSVWLFESSLLRSNPFPEQYTQEDIIRTVGEDDKLLEILIEQEVPINTTRLATLRYYLGGQSNVFSLDEEWGITDEISSDPYIQCGLIRIPR